MSLVSSVVGVFLRVILSGVVVVVEMVVEVDAALDRPDFSGIRSRIRSEMPVGLVLGLGKTRLLVRNAAYSSAHVPSSSRARISLSEAFVTVDPRVNYLAIFVEHEESIDLRTARP